MNTSFKELVASTQDEGIKVFVRTSTRELTLNDLEIVAGGRGGAIDPDG
jgi:hypothetical protein